MAITIGENVFRTPFDGLTVNGKLLQRAHVNGKLVFPDMGEHVVKLHCEKERDVDLGDCNVYSPTDNDFIWARKIEGLRSSLAIDIEIRSAKPLIIHGDYSVLPEGGGKAYVRIDVKRTVSGKGVGVAGFNYLRGTGTTETTSESVGNANVDCSFYYEADYKYDLASETTTLSINPVDSNGDSTFVHQRSINAFGFEYLIDSRGGSVVPGGFYGQRYALIGRDNTTALMLESYTRQRNACVYPISFYLMSVIDFDYINLGGDSYSIKRMYSSTDGIYYVVNGGDYYKDKIFKDRGRPFCDLYEGVEGYSSFSLVEATEPPYWIEG